MKFDEIFVKMTKKCFFCCRMARMFFFLLQKNPDRMARGGFNSLFLLTVIHSAALSGDGGAVLLDGLPGALEDGLAGGLDLGQGPGHRLLGGA